MKKQSRRGVHLAQAVVVVSAIAALAVVAHRNEAYAQGAAKPEDTVVFAIPGGPTQDVFTVCAAEDFTKKTGIRVEFVSIQAQQAVARVLAQRSNPTIDLVWSTPQTDYAGIQKDGFIPVTAAQVPNLANVDPKFGLKPNTGAVVATTIQGIQYNTKTFKEKGLAPPTSWKDLWDPKYKGHVAIYGLGIAPGPGLLAVAGMLNGGDPKNFDAGFEMLAKLKPNLYTIFQQAPQYEAAMLDGSTWLGISANGRPLGMMQQGAPISFVQPIEGVVTANIYLSVVKGGPHPAATLALVNWMLSKEGQSCVIRGGYAPVSKDVSIPPELVPFMTLQRNVIPLDWDFVTDKIPDLLKRWNKEMDG